MTKKNLVPKSSSTESTKYIVLQWSTLVAPTRLWSVDRSKTYTNAILPFLISKCAKVRTWEHRHIARRPNYHIIFVLIIQHAAPCNILRTDRGRHQRLWTMCGGWYSGGKSSIWLHFTRTNEPAISGMGATTKDVVKRGKSIPPSGRLYGVLRTAFVPTGPKGPDSVRQQNWLVRSFTGAKKLI